MRRCRDCSNPAASKSPRCPVCRLRRRRETQRGYKRRRHAKKVVDRPVRKCVDCDNPAIGLSPRCDVCRRRKRREQQYAYDEERKGVKILHLSERTHRVCLKCEKKFLSESKVDRVCSECEWSWRHVNVFLAGGW